MRVVISGGSGLIGRALSSEFEAQGSRVTRLVRRPAKAGEVQWQIDQPPFAAVEQADLVVNLSGAGIGDKRWSESYRREILNSRVIATKSLASAVARAEHKPTFISMSAVGIYGDQAVPELTEQSLPGNSFLAGVTLAWEAATEAAENAGARVVSPRMSMVLDAHLGALPKLIKLYRLGLGGPLGSGRQHWPWISSRDAARALVFLSQSELAGPVNLVAPQLTTNRQFNHALGEAVHRPALIPVPPFALQLALGGFGAELLANQPVVPMRLQAAGFEWLDRDITATLRSLVALA